MHRHSWVPSGVLRAAALVLALALAGCGGGGAGGGDSSPQDAAPRITSQPEANQTVTAGTSVSFHVAATGTPAPTYQWKKAGISIGNATADTYTLASPVVGDAGTYTVTVSNRAGSVDSDEAVLTVDPGLAAPVIAYSPAAFTFTMGTAISPVIPTSTGGAIASWGIAPALPAGLSFNAVNGRITGTPTAVSSSRTYTITATNAMASDTADITITVSATLAKPAIAYSPSSCTFTAGTAIATVVPTNTGGVAASWGIVPALPSGLAFNTGSGRITGTPTAASPAHTYTVTATNAAGSGTATLSVTIDAAPEPPANQPKLGTNLNWMMDWDPEKLAADLMWQARPWSTGDGNGTNVVNWTAVDAQGWPLVSAGTRFGAIFEMAPWVGTYKLSFRNRQGSTGDTVSSYSGNITLTNRQHDPGTNVTTYDVNVPSFSANQFIWLLWTGSTGGITDVHLMRPLQDGSGWHPVGTPLSDHVIDRLAHFTTIRTMQTGGGTSLTTGTDTVWPGRTKPWSSQQRSSDAGRSGGVAIENLIAMANQADKDLWITLPFRADDDYIRKVAQVLRYGSDGINPYTSEQASPVFAPLKPGLAVYVEHGNEIWNPGYGYWSSENYDLNQAEIAAGDPHHTTYRSSSSGTWGYSWRRVGWLVVRHSLIFRQVFGDAAMMTRVRPILASQNSRYATTSEPLHYIRDVWGQGYGTSVVYGSVNEFGNVARPASYYVYALATALYFPDDNSALNVSSASTLLDGVTAQLGSTAAESLLVAAAWNQDIAASLGLKYVAYEGGDNLIPSLMSGGATSANIANARLASFDPAQGGRMGANIDAGTGLPRADQGGYIYGRVFSEWARLGGGLFMHFTLGQAADGGGMFGLCPPSAQSGSDPRLETGPKWEAVKAFGRAWGQ